MTKDISKNKIFASPYKNEIEQRLAMGQSPRAISNWLKTRGEEISYATINEYKKNFFNVDVESAKIVKEKQKETELQLANVNNIDELEEKQRALLETDRNMHLATVRAVNHISLLYSNINDMMDYLDKLRNYEPLVASHAARGIWQEIRATIESLEKIKEKEGESDNSSVAKLLSELKKKKREVEGKDGG